TADGFRLLRSKEDYQRPADRCRRPAAGNPPFRVASRRAPGPSEVWGSFTKRNKSRPVLDNTYARTPAAGGRSRSAGGRSSSVDLKSRPLTAGSHQRAAGGHPLTLLTPPY